MELTYYIKNWEEVTKKELYEMLQLRSAIFVVEQNCVYQDLDGKDNKSLHVLGYANNELVAYCRLFDKGINFEKASIGRVVVASHYRKHGFGHQLMQTAIKTIENTFNTNEIQISAQEYLKNFYETHGFIAVGASYLEDGIPHIKMIRNIS